MFLAVQGDAGNVLAAGVEQAVWEKIHEPETEVCYIFEKERGEFYVPGN